MFVRSRENGCKEVKVCIGKGISLTKEPKYPKATATKIVNKALWFNRKLREPSEPFASSISNIRSLMGPVPHEPFWPAINTLARAEAELINSRRRFLDEFEQMAIEAGHTYRLEVLEKEPDQKLPSRMKEMITSEKFLYDPKQYQELVDREKNDQATTDDKYLLQVYRYMSFWNVKWADEEFVDGKMRNDRFKHPINLDDKERALLVCLVKPSSYTVPVMEPTWGKKDQILLGAKLILEITKILGFLHIFDHTRIIDPSKLTDETIERLKRTALFSNNYAKAFFGIKPSKKEKEKRGVPTVELKLLHCEHQKTKNNKIETETTTEE